MGSLFLKPLHRKHRLLCLREGHGYQHGPSRTCFEVLVEKFSYCYTLKERMLSIYQEKILLFNEGHSFRKDVYGVVQRGREETPTQPSRSSGWTTRTADTSARPRSHQGPHVHQHSLRSGCAIYTFSFHTRATRLRCSALKYSVKAVCLW